MSDEFRWHPLSECQAESACPIHGRDEQQRAPLPADAIVAGSEAIYPPTRYGRDEQHCRITATRVLEAAAPALRAQGAATERARIRDAAKAAPAIYMDGKRWVAIAELLDGTDG